MWALAPKWCSRHAEPCIPGTFANEWQAGLGQIFRPFGHRVPNDCEGAGLFRYIEPTTL